MQEEIVSPLLGWYQENKRELPWRKDRNPYFIWVSEIMLQQTRVEAVKPYFRRFVQELPDVPALAACPEERLLKLWEGLGYYNRVRNMQKAAVTVTERYGGILPADDRALRELPGIGSYTAGAIASIAYGIPVPAVDGNVLRIFSRLQADGRDMQKQSVRRSVEEELLRILPAHAPGDFNQALMDLGASVCLPGGAPRCGECPLSGLCRAHREGREVLYPVKREKKSRRIEERTVLLIQDGDRIALRKRPPRGLLAGLYEFPNLPGFLREEEALEQVRGFGLTPLHIRKLEKAKHIFSHVEWHMSGYGVRVASLDSSCGGDLMLVPVEKIRTGYPVPSAFEAYANNINLRLGAEKKLPRMEK